MLEYLLYMIAMAITPGPNTIMSLANASAKGLKGVTLNLGMLVGITMITSVSYLLITLLTTFIPTLTIILQILGILYILYLAYRMLKKSSLTEGGVGGFRTGLLMQLVNVKVLMMCVSSISVYVLPFGFSFWKGYLVSLLIPVVCFLSGLVWAVAGAVLKKLYLNHPKAFNSLFSLALFALALKNLMALIQTLQ